MTAPVRIPRSRYTSPEYAALELEHMWPRVWQVACTIDHVGEPGDVFEFRCGPLSVLVVRGDDGALRAFQNTCRHRGNQLLRGPNDVVFDEAGGLWFTDHGKGRLRSVDRGALCYLPPGGSAVRRIAFPLLGPNGVGLSPDDRTVYVAETHTGRLWAWDLEAPGEVRPRTGSLAVRHGGYCVAATPYSFDSLAVEDDGRIAVAAIGDGIVVITPDGEEAEVYPIPGDVTTNLAFGGTDRRRAVITLSRSGRLAETTWPRPGLALHLG